MKRNSKTNHLVNVFNKFQNTKNTRRSTTETTQLDPNMAMLRTWQVERFKRTYSDLLADKQYRQAFLFFLNDIYGPHDFSGRDQDVEQLHSIISGYLPSSLVNLLADIITLNNLTNILDKKLLQVLVDNLNVAEELSSYSYAQAYQMCDNYDEREHQIALTVNLFGEIVTEVDSPMVGLTLKMVKRPARRAGWYDLYGFLERGFAAFKPIRDVTPLINIIKERELRILNRIYNGDTDPFQMDEE